MEISNAKCPFCHSPMYLESNGDGFIAAYCKGCEFCVPELNLSIELEYSYKEKDKIIDKYETFVISICERMSTMNFADIYTRMYNYCKTIEEHCEKDVSKEEKMKTEIDFFYEGTKTICILNLSFEDRKKESFGIAKLNPIDTYSYKIGEKLALKRAIEKIEFKSNPKRWRKQIWEKYFDSSEKVLT